MRASVALEDAASSPARALVMSMAAAAAVVERVAAQDGGASSSGSNEEAEEVSSSGDGSSGSDGSLGASVYINDMKEGYTVLIRRRANFWSEQGAEKICKQQPFLLSKDGPANGQCTQAMTSEGLSCTCLRRVRQNKGAENDGFEFKVVAKTQTAGKAENSAFATSVLQITHIAPIFYGRLPSIKIVGTGSTPQPIRYWKDISNQGVTSGAALEASKKSLGTLKIAWLENLDLKDALSNPDFFPPSLTNLTLVNCNVGDDQTDFLKQLTVLQRLDMENNRLTKLPAGLFASTRLEYVNMKGNTLADLRVSQKDFLTIANFAEFDVDVASTSCTTGTQQVAHGLNFCVTTASNGGSNQNSVDSAASETASSNKILLIGVIGGCVVVVILLFLIVRKRSTQAKDDAFVKHTNSVFEDTLSFDHSSHEQSVSSALLNDPIIITHRIPYNDIKIATCISRGGFGLVYSGTFNRRRVAIKKIRSDINADIKQIEMFLKEICLMASLSHPRIVEFIGVSWDSLRNLCAVTEFMERGDLRDVLQSAKARNTRLTWDGHKSHIAMHVAEALTYLHSLTPKVIHRDLKSKNILIDNDMSAKLSDFGVSRERRVEETHMTAGIGTAFWIAPEVLLGMDYDERADIFSFGVVLSEIDTDDYPYWNEKNPASGGKQQENVILRMVATGALQPEFSKTCPLEILDIAQACLNMDPDLRPTAAQLVYLLQQVIRSSPLTPSSSISPV